MQIKHRIDVTPYCLAGTCQQYGAAHITALNASIRHRPYKPAQACAYQGLNEVVSDYKYILRAAP